MTTENPKTAILVPSFQPVDPRLMQVLMEAGIPFFIEQWCEEDLPRFRSATLSLALGRGVERIIMLDPGVVPTVAQVRLLATTDAVNEDAAVVGAYPLRTRQHWSIQTLADVPVKLGTDELFEIRTACMGFAAVDARSLRRVALTLPGVKDENGLEWWPFAVPVVLRDKETQGYTYLPDTVSFWHRLAKSGTRLFVKADLVAALSTNALITFPDQVPRAQE
jgi:hypothetical protein